jgi:hypothetical protein
MLLRATSQKKNTHLDLPGAWRERPYEVRSGGYELIRNAGSVKRNPGLTSSASVG